MWAVIVCHSFKLDVWHFLQAIDGLYRDGVKKPLQLFNILRSRKIMVGSKKQIDNYLARLKAKVHGPPTVTYNDVSQWCELKRAEPDDEHQVYVLHHLVDASLGRLCVVLSTKALQRLAQNSMVVQTDATYKLIWQGYPAILASVSDASRQTFPVAFAVSSGETAVDYELVLRTMKEGVERISGSSFAPRVVVGDSADAISTAVERVFPDALRRVCWFHVRKNIEKHLRKESSMRTTCLRDISVLQLAQSREQFEQAGSAMLEKWKGLFPTSEFPETFRKLYLHRNSSWYEGFDRESPSTNNALESFNQVIKRYTFRERLPVGQFLSHCEEMIKEWSLDTTDRRPYMAKPVITTKDYKDGWIYMQENKTPCVLEGSQTWFLPAGDKQRVDVGELTAYLQTMESCSDFDSYAEQRRAVWVVQAGESDELPHCTCPVGVKARVCKHVVAVGVWNGLLTVPDVAKHAVIGQKRKRGRPAATASALQLQR